MYMYMYVCVQSENLPVQHRNLNFKIDTNRFTCRWQYQCTSTLCTIMCILLSVIVEYTISYFHFLSCFCMVPWHTIIVMYVIILTVYTNYEL